MSKDFDTTLSDTIDLAAGAAQTAGASAARIRGRQRTMRKRIAVSTMSLVVVAVGTTVAFKATSSTGGSAPLIPANSPSPTASPSSTAGPSPTGSPNSSPTGSPVTSPTGSPSASASGSTTATSGSQTWLTPAQVPFDSIMNWTAGSPNHCIGSMVFISIYPGGCNEHNDPGGAHVARDMDTVIFKSTGAPTGNGAWAPPAADQTFYTYANTADAQSALQSITHDILNEDAQFDRAIDPNTNRPIVSTTTVTAQTAGSMAIDHKLRDDRGTPGQVTGNASESSDVHYFFAVKGDVLEVLEIQGGPSISDTTNDTAILQTVVNALG